MNKFLGLVVILLFSLFTSSCDFVKDPIEGAGNTGTTGTHVRRVLVEDYTGHKCTACPQAAITANHLEQTFGDKVVIIAVHAGFFATPSTPAGGAPGSYLTDFRTTTGDTYDSPTFFGISSVGNPNGMVNRKGYPSNTHVKSHSSWSSEVATILASEPDADLTITNTYNSSTRSLHTTLSSEFLSSTLPNGLYKLVVLITQDSIIDWQLDGVTHVPDYVHRHVLRDAINSTWGDTVVFGAVTPNVSITKNYVYSIPTSYKGNACNVNHCHVVAFIYDAATYEVIQAADAKVIQ